MTMVDGDSSSSEEEAPEEDSKWKGVLVTRGMDFRVEGLQLRIGEEGLESSIGGISARQDQCSHWLEIAVSHLHSARVAHEELIETYESEGDGDLVESIEQEFQASMQAMVACAVALDALYAAVKERIGISEELVAKWRDNDTPRSAQIAEVLGRGFYIRKKEKMQRLKHVLKEMFKFRDWAVHPPADLQPVVPRKDIKRGVEWRLSAFRYSNARSTVRQTLSLISRLATKSRMKTDALEDYCQFLHERVEPLVEDWERTYPDLEL